MRGLVVGVANGTARSTRRFPSGETASSGGAAQAALAEAWVQRAMWADAAVWEVQPASGADEALVSVALRAGARRANSSLVVAVQLRMAALAATMRADVHSAASLGGGGGERARWGPSCVVSHSHVRSGRNASPATPPPLPYLS